MAKLENRIALVVPMYNESNRFRPDRFAEALNESENLHYILVNDGSSDATGEIIDSFARNHPARCISHHLHQNQGKAEAVRQGLILGISGGFRFLGYWDADLATPLAAVRELQHEMMDLRHPDVVLGSRVQLLGREIQRSPVRHFIGRVFATLASLSLGLRVYDTQCGAKLLRNETWLVEALQSRFTSGWAFDVELLSRYLVRCRRLSIPHKIVEVPLRQWVDVEGSTVQLPAALAAFASLIQLGIKQRRQIWATNESYSKFRNQSENLPDRSVS